MLVFFFGGIRVYTVYGQQCSGVTWFHCNEQSLLKYGTLYVKIRNYKNEDFFSSLFPELHQVHEATQLFTV